MSHLKPSRASDGNCKIKGVKIPAGISRRDRRSETEAQEIGKGIFENRGQTKRSPGFASPSLYLNDKGTGDEAAHRPGDAS